MLEMDVDKEIVILKITWSQKKGVSFTLIYFIRYKHERIES